MTHNPSLRTRLLALLVTAVATVWALAAMATYVDAHRAIDRLLDAHLAQATAVLAAEAGHELLELDAGDLPDAGDFGHGVTFQVWEEGHGLVLKSADAPGVRLSSADHGFTDSMVAGRHWRVFTARDRERRALVEVAEDHVVRERIAGRAALNALRPLALALPLLAVLVWWIVSHTLRPLTGLGEQLRGRRPQALDALDTRSIPAEALPLVQRLNELFSRIRHSTDLQRRFTADASHELRKPVAAVRAQAEVARTTGDVSTRGEALDKVIRACDRMAGLIDQLLTLARLDQDAGLPAAADVDLAATVRQAIADAVVAGASDADFTFESAGNAHVTGQALLLGTLVRNLLANALHHGAPPVQVSLVDTGAGVHLTVSDHGPGVPAAEMARLGERFFRGQAAGEGSGLGLSIVRRIAEIHGASVGFGAGASGGGLAVTLTFPPGPPAHR
ncbi:MAG: sensor histidine kinase N-terminal domain-containing protein [Gammaproteobacteria bacterium]|nr:sensor histidine kinase N-terminal domain-containing protein [Gammaproteobacteria bacterium]